MPRITKQLGMGTGLPPRPIVITTASHEKSPKMGAARAGQLSEENSLTTLACWIAPTGEAQQEARL